MFKIKDLVAEVTAKKKTKVRPKKATGYGGGLLKTEEANKDNAWKDFLRTVKTLKKHLDKDKAAELEKAVKALRPSMVKV